MTEQITIDQALSRAGKAADQGNPALAEKLYKAVLQKFPANEIAINGLSRLGAATGGGPSPPPDNQLVELDRLLKSGQLDTAEQACRDLAKDYPESVPVQEKLGTICLHLEKYEEAIPLYEKITRIKPDLARAQNNFAIALKETGQFERAITVYREAIRLNPDFAEGYNNLGNAYQTAGYLEKAIHAFDQAIRLRPDFALAFCNRGRALYGLKRLDEALESYDKAIELKPDYAKAYLNRGVVHQALGRIKEAVAEFESTIRLKPDYAEAHRYLSNFKRFQAEDPQIVQMERLARDRSRSAEERMNLNFALAKAYKDTGDDDKAFACFKEGNRLRKRQLDYRFSSDESLFSKIKALFSAGISPLSDQDTAAAAPLTKQPIFILGMPRSGTTLVEQILASHSRVFGAGELKSLGGELGKYCDLGNSPSTRQLTEFRHAYLSVLSGLGASEPCITDKMPYNFRWIGFIVAAFPEAKIIHVKRRPPATCWSIFQHCFTETGNGFAYDLEDVAGYYNLYRDLMAFWHDKYPNRIYDLSYEALTENQEPETRRLIEYAGLDWEDACLSFHQTRRMVKTASASQVIKKMYQGSSEKWRRFEKYLTPMLKTLKQYKTGGAGTGNGISGQERGLDPSQEQMDALNQLYIAGQLKEAEQTCKTLLADYPESGFVANLLGAVCHARGQFEEAVKIFDTVIRRHPAYARAYNNRGAALKAMGRLEEALASYDNAVRINPNYADAHRNRANALRKMSRPEEAVQAYDNAIRTRPNFAAAHSGRGDLLRELGRHSEAETSYREIVRLQPGSARAHNDLGLVCYDLGRIEEALACHQTAIKLNPDYEQAYCDLGNTLQVMGRLDKAVESYETALKLNPDYAIVHNNRGVAYRALGQKEKARQDYEAAIRLKPAYIDAHHNLSNLKKFEANDPQIDQLKKLMAHPRISEKDRTLLNFALGNASFDLGDDDIAFSYFLEGNRLKKKALNYHIQRDRNLFGQIKSAFSGDAALFTLPQDQTGQPSHLPIFILGMPRSGTTLVEQILASHTKVRDGGELKLLARTIRDTSQRFTDLSADKSAAIRRQYLSGLASMGANTPYITDKMPINFRWIGFLIQALPEAKIIHVKRKAPATCWSIFKRCFTDTGNGYAFDLEDLANYYGMYEDLMAFWHDKFPGKIYDLNYEALTENQESETRKLLEYAGLDWEEGCLEFHKTDRAVRTASSLQVRQKMYQGSSEKWRRFEKHLGPMMAVLNET